MNSTQAKELINLLADKWGIKNKEFLLQVVGYLDKNIYVESNFYHEFEFSIIEGEPKIRILHLYFWQPNSSSKLLKKYIQKREKIIIFLFKMLTKEFNCSYNISMLKLFFRYNRNTGLWPIQFGLEYKKWSQPKIKLYLSLREKYSSQRENFSLKKFSDEFNLNFVNLNILLKNKKLDTVAMDFLPHRIIFKFYPYTQENQGRLYRILPPSNVNSIKVWHRFSQGILLKNILKKISLPLFLKEFIQENNCKIYYLCQEENKRSIYFR